jgi:hypothetical protein
MSGCTWILSQSAGFDRRPVTLQTLSLYNQRLKGRLSNKPWKGDWVLRRHRLALVDSELRGIKPDIALFQQLMSRIASPSESDRAILSAGALVDYEWDQAEIKDYSDTQETESTAVVISSSLRFLVGKLKETKWSLGESGSLQHSIVMYENQSIDIFNLQFDFSQKSQDFWIDFLDTRLKERALEKDFCEKRVIIGGYIPVSDLSENFQKLILRYDLKDAASGYCVEENRCYTATPTNDIFLASVGDESPSRPDRIYLNQSTLVYTSRRNFGVSDSNDEYAKSFGIDALWPSQRFGWGVQFRLPRCSS